MGKYPLNSFIVEAIYTAHERAIYAGNPWIEALPNIPDDQEMFQNLEEKIPYDETERELPDYIRKDAVNSLTQLLIPLSQNGEIARKVYSAIREGYLNRNPLSQRMKAVSAQLQQCVITRDSSFRNLSNSNANANGFCIVGDSGLGKTTAVNKALNIFPQVIIHQQYCGEPFNSGQLVWLRLECPHDCSVKGLITDFFEQFDRVMNDNTHRKYAEGRVSLDQMIPQMALIAKRHGLGLLVIDEIQNLSRAKSGGAEKMLSLIVQLVNTVGVPVLLVGTPNAVPFLSSDLMTVRRSAGQQGMTKLHPLSQESSDWERLLKKLWKYQWTHARTTLTDELSSILHEYSAGNIDAAIKIYMQAQRIAISGERRGGSGAIDAEVLHAAARSDELSDVLARLHLEQKWALEKQPKRTSSHPISDSAPQKTPSTQSTKKTPSKGTRQKQPSDLKSLEERGLIVKPTDEF